MATVRGVDLRAWGQLFAALAAGLALRLAFVVYLAHVSPDGLMYGDMAQNLLHHGVYGQTVTVDDASFVKPSLLRLPGYPLFLALIFAVWGVGKWTAVMGVQLCFDLWTCLLCAGIARRLFDSRIAFVAALWLGCLCPFMANYVAEGLTETLTLWCIAAAFYGLVRWQQTDGRRWLWVMGLVCGYGVLLRPEQGMLAVCVVGAMVWARRFRLGPVLLVCVLTVLPLAPWAVRNWRTFHVFQPLAPRYANDPGEANPYGFQRWFRTFAIDFASTDRCYWLYDGDTVLVKDLPSRAFDSKAQYEQTAALFADYNQATTATPALDARFASIAEDRVNAHPVRYYVWLPLARLFNMIFRPRGDMLSFLPVEWWKFRLHPGETLFGYFYAALNFAYLALAWIGWRRGRWLPQYQPVIWGMLATIVLRCVLLLTVDDSEPRYTLEFYPVLLVLGGGGLAWLRRRHALQDAAY